MGHSEISVCIWLFGVFFLIFAFMYLQFLGQQGFEVPIIIWLLVFLNILFTGVGIIWMPYFVSKYQLRPGLDKCGKNETTWLRCTLDRIIVPQFVDKGPYGQNKGVAYKSKADIIDDGSFVCKWLNGNSVTIMFDGMNTAIDLMKSATRKEMKKKYGVRDGVEAYNKAKEKGELVHGRKD